MIRVMIAQAVNLMNFLKGPKQLIPLLHVVNNLPQIRRESRECGPALSYVLLSRRRTFTLLHCFILSSLKRIWIMWAKMVMILDNRQNTKTQTGDVLKLTQWQVRRVGLYE